MTTRNTNNARWLKLGHYNVRGLRAREVEVKELFETEELDVLSMV